MNVFATTLNDIISKRDISNNKAAKLCQIDTSLLRRYRNGERIPRNDKIFQKLKDGLHLTQEEYDRLCHFFHAIKNGTTNLYREDILISEQEKVISAIQDHSISQLLPYIRVVMHECQNYHFTRRNIPVITRLQNTDQLAECLAYLAEDAKKNNETLHIFTFYSFFEKREFIDQYLLKNGVDTEQVILYSSPPNYNELICSFLQHVNFCTPGYAHRIYICQNLNTVLREHSAIVFTDHALIKCEHLGDSISGIMTCDPQIISYYKNRYENYVQESVCEGDDIYKVFLKYLRK